MDADLALALALADLADVITMRHFQSVDLRVETKPDMTPVTEADRGVERTLRERLAEVRSADAVVGEEYGTEGASQRRWVIDPVDGTKNFVHGSPNHAVMAAELRGGEVVRSWIWQPQLGAAYVAERGEGAWRNGERLVRPPVGEVLRGVTSRRRWIGRALDGLSPLELTWVCCGVDYPKLVEGEADYLLYAGTKPWDHAPGSLLLEESGAYLGTFEGGRYRPQEDPPRGLVGAADRATYERVEGLVGELG
jgi:fructose-1,6-bisphosphatase/inositol monophosphatase family enzyme